MFEMCIARKIYVFHCQGSVENDFQAVKSHFFLLQNEFLLLRNDFL